jgi:hypothetical protein
MAKEKQVAKKAPTRVKTEQLEYNPAKPYKWEPEDTFTFNGIEFGMLFNVILAKKAEVMGQMGLIEIMEAKITEAVKAGVAKEVVQEDKG